jgi:hypothetical protein
MGCDIHGWFEVYWRKKWIATHQIPSNRNYFLFAIFANVRNYEDKLIPICDARGLPHDISIKALEDSDQWNGDGHSHSYLDYQELINYDIMEAWFDTNPIVRDIEWGMPTKYIMEYLDHFRDIANKYKVSTSKVRMVFWFDN